MNYISVLEALQEPRNKPYSEITWLTCKANSSNLSEIFFVYPAHYKESLCNVISKIYKDRDAKKTSFKRLPELSEMSGN